jgi:hypothetical protein
MAASSTTINGVTYIAAGSLKVYDGASAFEDGFAYYPTISDPAKAFSAGDVADGTYSYAATYEWLDNKGNLHRSSPSEIKTGEMTAGPAAMDVLVDNLQLTDKENSGRTDVKIVLWRTTAGPGLIFYRVAETDNIRGSDVQTFLDTLADDDITDNEILYTQGGILENIQPPACRFVFEHRGRLVVGGLENG